MSSLPVIGWIGAGRMGVAMAGFILKAGYPLLVYSPTAASRQKLVALGAREALSVAQCATAADIIFSCITNDAALREVALGPQGVLDNAKPGVIFIDTSTVSAEISAQVAEQAQTRGIFAGGKTNLSRLHRLALPDERARTFPRDPRDPVQSLCRLRHARSARYRLPGAGPR